MVKDGYFGFKDYFKSLCDNLENGDDFYLLGSDFASYLEAQVSHFRLHDKWSMWFQLSYNFYQSIN